MRASRDEETAIARRFLSAMDYFRITEMEINTAVDGDVGIAWGFFAEELQPRGGRPENVRVRFTMTAKKEAGGWRQLLYHRDAQPFSAEGRYFRAPVGAP